MTLTIYYHVAGMNNWPSVVAEQLRILKEGGFSGSVRTGFCGPMGGEDTLKRLGAEQDLDVNIVAREYDWRNFEFPTLSVLWNDCKLGLEGNVLYFHTKGVSKPNSSTAGYWRWFMNAYMLRQRAASVSFLKDHDFCGPAISHYPFRHSCGNYFAATTSYIRTLPEINTFRTDFMAKYGSWLPWSFSDRHAAEMWIDCTGRGIARQLHTDPDCNLLDRRWWSRRPDIKLFAAQQGS